MSKSLQIIIDGLRSLCLPHERRIEFLDSSENSIDEYFDFIVLDYLDGLVEREELEAETAESIRTLFLSGEELLKGLHWKQEDGLFRAAPEKMKEFENEAARLLVLVESHNNKRQCAPSGAGRQNRCAVSPPLR